MAGPSSLKSGFGSSSGMRVRVPGGFSGPEIMASMLRRCSDGLISCCISAIWHPGGVTVEAIRSGIDLSHLDSDARPQDDLFGHVNGRWLTEYEMPADRATDGAFRSLYDRAEEHVRDLITGAATAATSDGGAAPSTGTDEQRIGDLYASFMNEQTVAERGVQPLLDELATIDAVQTPEALAAVVGALQRSGVGGGAGRRGRDQAGRRALGRRQAPRRGPYLQPAHVRRPAG